MRGPATVVIGDTRHPVTMHLRTHVEQGPFGMPGLRSWDGRVRFESGPPSGVIFGDEEAFLELPDGRRSRIFLTAYSLGSTLVEVTGAEKPPWEKELPV